MFLWDHNIMQQKIQIQMKRGENGLLGVAALLNHYFSLYCHNKWAADALSTLHESKAQQFWG